MPEEGTAAIVEVAMENFFTYSYEKILYAETMMEDLLDWQVPHILDFYNFFWIFDCNHTSYLRQVAVALSPNLGEGEMRIVLSWETTQDLDIYALQMDK